LYGFLVLVILHETGHFIASKKFWVKVYEFWLWIPPKVKTLYKDKSWTEYTLNALPLWWFIRPKWENISSEEEITAKDSFHSKPFWQKVIILLWWVFMNLLIAFLLFMIAFWIWIKPIFIIPDSSNKFVSTSYLFPSQSFAQKVWYIKKEEKPLKIEWILKNEKTLSSQIDFKTWDIINSIWWEKITTSSVSTILRQYLWKDVKIWVLRNNQQLYFTWTCPDDGCLLGVFYSSDRKIQKLDLTFFQAVKASIHEIISETKLTFDWLKLFYHKLTSWEAKKAVETMSGPVWAVAVGKYILSIWVVEYLAFIASISLALAIFNVLPIPALDGWRILTTAIMHLFRLNPKKYLIIENYITLVFFAVLMIFWFYIMYQDWLRFYSI